jgi:hypothetical protein
MNTEVIQGFLIHILFNFNSQVCFQSKTELQDAVQLYIDQDCTTNRACEAGETYGWPIGIWCVSQVTDMSGLFKDARL